MIRRALLVLSVALFSTSMFSASAKTEQCFLLDEAMNEGFDGKGKFHKEGYIPSDKLVMRKEKKTYVGIGLVLNFDAFHHDRLQRPVGAVGRVARHGDDGVDHVHARNHLAENRVAVV